MHSIATDIPTRSWLKLAECVDGCVYMLVTNIQ
jgi:hypothetical protein